MPAHQRLEALLRTKVGSWGATRAEDAAAILEGLFGASDGGAPTAAAAPTDDAPTSPPGSDLHKLAVAVVERGCTVDCGSAPAAAGPPLQAFGMVHGCIAAICPRLLRTTVEAYALSGGRTAPSRAHAELLRVVYQSAVKSKALPPLEGLPLPSIARRGEVAAQLTMTMLKEQAATSAASAFPIFATITAANIPVVATVVMALIALWVDANRATLLGDHVAIAADLVALLMSPTVIALLGRSSGGCLPAISIIHTITNLADGPAGAVVAERLPSFADACLAWYSALLQRGNAKPLRYLHAVMGVGDEPSPVPTSQK